MSRRTLMSPRSFAYAAILAALALPPTVSLSAQSVAPPPGIDEYIEAVRERFEVPGLSVAIVKDGQVVMAKGYGERSLGEDDPVDAQTLFGIASNTKVVTATALGILVAEGKLEWDAPVVRYLPGFQMYDAWVTRQITVRDILVHRSGLGLGAGDLMFWPPTTFTRKELVERLRYIPPATSFRSAYAYDNVLYAVAGEVIEAVSGQSWEDFVRTRILEPVGMTRSDVRLSDPATTPNAASTHARVEGTVQHVPPYLGDVVGPAGGIFSNTEDMAKWLIVQLDSGRVATNERIYPPSVTSELWAPVTPVPFADPPPELAPAKQHFNFYALGLEVMDYRGERLLRHSGGLPGYLSRVAMLPQRRLGVVVLTNQESGEAFDAIAYRILDYYQGAPEHNWLEAFTAVKARNDARIAERDAQTTAQRRETSTPSLELGDYAGTYRDAWYGDVVISLGGDGLVIDFTRTPSLLGDMVHWQYNTFLVQWRQRELRADAFITFSFNPDGSIERARIVPASPTVDFSFDFQDLDLRPRR